MRKISDHSSWIGKGMPMGTKSKTMEAGMGCGEVYDYPDTAEKVKAYQDGQVRAVKAKKADPMRRS